MPEAGQDRHATWIDSCVENCHDHSPAITVLVVLQVWEGAGRLTSTTRLQICALIPSRTPTRLSLPWAWQRRTACRQYSADVLDPGNYQERKTVMHRPDAIAPLSALGIHQQAVHERCKACFDDYETGWPTFSAVWVSGIERSVVGELA